jgi:predicted ATPase
LTRGALQTAREFAEECLALAERQSEPPRLPHAHFALGSTLFFLGDVVLARQHLEQGIALYDPQVHRSRSLNDPGMSCLILTAFTLWLLGYPDQALVRIQEAFDLAEKLSSPFNMAYVLACAPLVHQGRGEPLDAQGRAADGRNLSKEQEFPHWLALSTTLEGWAMAAQGQGEEGRELMQQGLRAWRAMGAQQTVPYQLALLAEAYGRSGLADEGLRAVAEGLAIAEQNAEHYYLAELYRIQGELYLVQSDANDAAAQASFDQAFRIARTQQAKSLELRAAMSTSRLWQRQGKQRQAHALLSDIYGRFSEGFETGDLQATKALLDALDVY